MMMRERRLWIERGGWAMHEWRRPKRRAADDVDADEQCYRPQRYAEIGAERHHEIVRMLIVNECATSIGLAGLEHLR